MTLGKYHGLLKAAYQENMIVRYSQKRLVLSRFYRSWRKSSSKRNEIIENQILVDCALQILKKWNDFSANATATLIKASNSFSLGTKMKFISVWRSAFRTVLTSADRCRLLLQDKEGKLISYYLNEWRLVGNRIQRCKEITTKSLRMKSIKCIATWRHQSNKCKADYNIAMNYYLFKLKKNCLVAFLENYSSRLNIRSAQHFARNRLQKRTFLAFTGLFNRMKDLKSLSTAHFQSKRLGLWKKQKSIKQCSNLADKTFCLSTLQVSFTIWKKKKDLHCKLYEFKIVANVGKRIHFSSNHLVDLFIEWKRLTLDSQKLRIHFTEMKISNLKWGFQYWRQYSRNPLSKLGRELALKRSWTKWEKNIQFKISNQSLYNFRLVQCKHYFSIWRNNFQNCNFQRQRQKVIIVNLKSDYASNLV